MPPLRRAVLLALAFALVAALAAACRPRAHETATAPATDAAVSDDSALVTAEGETFRVRSWSFPLATTKLSLVDLGMHAPLPDALSPSSRLAINAAFFDPEGRPVGLAVSAGKQLSAYSPTLVGGVLYVQDGRAHLEATETFDPRTPSTFALQCRPRLVVDARPNVSRDDGHHTDRTALCIRDEGATLDVIVATQGPSSPGPSLYALSHYLTTQHPCTQALNLDGGPSTGFAARVPGSPTPAVLWPRGPLRFAVAFE